VNEFVEWKTFARMRRSSGPTPRVSGTDVLFGVAAVAIMERWRVKKAKTGRAGVNIISELGD